MLNRYTRPEMAELWGREETKLEYWLKVELAFLAARVQRGEISREAYEAIHASTRIDVARMKAIEDEVGHDMIAFVKMIQESLVAAGVGQHKGRFHELLTSYNTEDPAMVMMLRRAAKLIVGELYELVEVLRARAIQHRYTYLIMRSHGQFAEPSSFGHLLLVYANAIDRGITRIQSAVNNDLSEGNISGAVGSYGEIDPQLESLALSSLGLRPSSAATQILQRDRHASLLSAIALVGSSIGQMARTFWEMCRSEVRELEEPRKAKQRGSSAMAHKKNPIGLEQLIGMPRLLRGYCMAALENIETPEARDISQSSVERHIFPDSTALLHYMAVKATSLVKGLVVFPERMQHNLLVATRGTWAGQPVRTALMGAGVDYDTAYEHIQRLSFEAMSQEGQLQELLRTSPIGETSKTALDLLGEEKLASCFDPENYVRRGIDAIFEANGLQG